MSFIHDVGQRVGRAAQTMGKRTEEMATVGKLNVEIGKLKAEIKQLTARLGEAAYSAYVEGLDWAEVCGPICEEIRERHERIAEIDDEVARFKEETEKRIQARKDAAASRVRKSPADAPGEEASVPDEDVDFIPRQSGGDGGDLPLS